MSNSHNIYNQQVYRKKIITQNMSGNNSVSYGQSGQQQKINYGQNQIIYPEAVNKQQIRQVQQPSISYLVEARICLSSTNRASTPWSSRRSCRRRRRSSAGWRRRCCLRFAKSENALATHVGKEDKADTLTQGDSKRAELAYSSPFRYPLYRLRWTGLQAGGMPPRRWGGFKTPHAPFVAIARLPCFVMQMKGISASMGDGKQVMRR